MTRRQADDRADATADYRAQVQADRTRRTGIYESRAAATTAQGNQRLAQANERIALSRSKGAGGGSKAKPKISPHNSDLSYLLQ